MRRIIFVLLCIVSSTFLLAGSAASQVPNDPVYMRTQDGYKGFFPHGDEYAQYLLAGPKVKLQDPYHVLLNPGLGVMVTFADKRQFPAGKDLLASHLEWELEYWRKHASRVESAARDDLSGGRTDLRVTELTLYNPQGQSMKVCLMALASKEGVFVLSISPVDGSTDSLVRDLAASFVLVHKTLDAGEIKRLSAAEKAAAR
jgi:hypothetical protein